MNEHMKEKSKTKKSGKQVKFDFLAPEAQEVFLSGDFNNWDTDSIPMKKDKKGVWKTALSLKPGTYQYRFFVDKEWKNDDSCAGCMPNKFGSHNCVKVVE